MEKRSKRSSISTLSLKEVEASATAGTEVINVSDFD